MSSESVQPRTRVQIFEEFKGCASKQWLEDVATKALFASQVANVPESGLGAVLDIVLADDETVERLNTKHRGLHETTDVLAFSFVREGEYHGDDPPPAPPDGFDFVTPPGQGAVLGEVIISYPQAVRQARQSGHEVAHELAALLVHGVLHLVGYDHMEPDEEAAMKALESAVLSRVLSNE